MQRYKHILAFQLPWVQHLPAILATQLSTRI